MTSAPDAASAFEHLPAAALLIAHDGTCAAMSARFRAAFDVSNAPPKPHFAEIVPGALRDAVGEMLHDAAGEEPPPTEVGGYVVFARALPGQGRALVFTFVETDMLPAVRARAISRDQLVSHLSHELRSPISAILGFADLLSGRITDREDRLAVSSIRRNTAHLLDLVSNALDLTRLDKGSFPLEWRAVAVDEVVAQVQSMMEPRASEKGLGFHIEYAGKLPAQVHSDALRLRQILVNLIGNAVKFTDEGEIVLKVEYDDAMHRIVFAVTDTGVGIGADKLERVFAAFDQGGSDVARRLGGSGLGLAIVRALVTALGGRIDVDSAPGKGSTFRFWIPVGEEYPLKLTEPRRDIEVTPATLVPGSLAGRTLLVVDDNLDVRESVSAILEAVGATTMTAAHGRQALDRVGVGDGRDEGAVDGIVMDIQMPVMDGIEATARLREAGFEGLIVALTAGATEEERSRCLHAGCDAVLVKPIQARRLVEVLRSLLEASEDAELEPQETATSYHGRLLLVDDHPDSAEALALLLSSVGFAVEVADSAQAAREKAADFEPTVLVVDFELPDGNGLELLRELKGGAGARSIAILISGHSLEDPDGTADAVLQKPISLNDVTRAVAERL